MHGVANLRRITGSLAASALLLLVASGVRGQTAAEPDPGPLDVSGLAEGRYATAEALLEKTIFNVDVMTLYMRFGPRTRDRVRGLATGRGDVPREIVAKVAATAEEAYVAARFERDVGLDRFVEGVRENMRAARDAGFITGAQYREVSAGLPRWFAYLADRGFEEGDHLLYRVRPDSLRTLHRTHDGAIRLDQTDEGPDGRLVLLGSYFAPGTDLRDDLLDSLLR